ncbi:hypothetical protein [Chelativorans sp.]|uniref:hypothetical protein n=1 Tax=Chelativorans sp. TaxID=2203393 RepID=UPI0028120635|nr:hypothetical protein [Chelativorans sp.]
MNGFWPDLRLCLNAGFACLSPASPANAMTMPRSVPPGCLIRLAKPAALSPAISKRVSVSSILIEPTFALRYAARLADHRQQPFRVGALLATERDREPDAALHIRAARLARRHRAARVVESLVALSLAGAHLADGQRRQILRHGPGGELLAHKRRGDPLGRDLAEQFGNEGPLRLVRFGGGKRHVEDLFAIARLDLGDAGRGAPGRR